MSTTAPHAAHAPSPTAPVAQQLNPHEPHPDAHKVFPHAAQALAQIGIPRHPEMPAEFEARYRRAEIYAASGLMPKGMDTAEKVFIALEIGLPLGLSPMMAVQNIAVVNGKPSVMFQVKLGIAENSTLLEYHNAKITGEGDTLACTYTIKRKGKAEVVKTFTHADAKRAGLLGKDNWKGYEPDMLTARAGDRAIKEAFPDLFAGLMSKEIAEDLEPEERAPAKPVWRMTTADAGHLKAIVNTLKIPAEAKDRIVHEATAGRDVPVVDKVKQFTEAEYRTIAARLKAWKPESAAPAAQAPAPTPPADRKAAAPSVPPAAESAAPKPAGAPAPDLFEDDLGHEGEEPGSSHD